jgi:RNA polymerase sigma-70 factor (ECF subfamily)
MSNSPLQASVAALAEATTADFDAVPDSRASFQEALLEQASVLRRQAERLVRDRADASDLVQDTLERALRCADSFQAGTNLRAWLLTIMTRLFVDRCRRQARGGRVDGIDLDALAAPVPDAAPRWADVTQTQLRQAFEQLDPTFREPYRLFAVERLPYQAIASRLSIPVATVGTRILRTRQRLRDLLEQQIGKAGS